MSVRLGWVSQGQDIPITRQCELVSVSRSVVYSHAKSDGADDVEILLLKLIDEEYTRHPFYGSRRMLQYLKRLGHAINRKRVQRLMRTLGLAGMSPGPNTSRAHPEHKIYPYLLRGIDVIRPNQVWSTDITYVRLEKGFVYLVAIIDWYSRRILAWRLFNTLETAFCVACLEEALSCHGVPETFNTDQGTQFTSQCFTAVLIREKIMISMDGRGRALDNIFVERLWRTIKYEDLYLKDYGSMAELIVGLRKYLEFYNHERPHQALSYRTPETVYRQAQGGGAKIVDKFSQPSDGKSVNEVMKANKIEDVIVANVLSSKTGQRCSAAGIRIT